MWTVLCSLVPVASFHQFVSGPNMLFQVRPNILYQEITCTQVFPRVSIGARYWGARTQSRGVLSRGRV